MPKWSDFTFLCPSFPNPQDVRLLRRPGRSLACGEEMATESEELGPPIPTTPARGQPPPRGCLDLSDTETAAVGWMGLP